MEINTAEKDQSGTNTHTGEEKVSENPLKSAQKPTKIRHITRIFEMKLIEPSGNTKTDRSVSDTLSISERPRRNPRPSEKAIENTIRIEQTKLEKAWTKVKSITALQNAPNSIDGIVQAIAQVRAEYNAYDYLRYSFTNFLTNLGTPDYLQELHRLGMLTRNNKQFVSENIKQGNQRKQEIMLEIKSIRSGFRASSMSSTALRAKARAQAAAALKKIENYKRHSLAESQSALNIQRKELALAKRKLEEQARLEALRLENEAAVAVARAKAIDDELGFDVSQEQNLMDLPAEDPQTRVQQFIDNQLVQPQTNNPQPSSRDTANAQQASNHLTPAAEPFITKNKPRIHGTQGSHNQKSAEI